MRPKSARLEYLLGARVSVTILFAIVFVISSSASAASAVDFTGPPPSENQGDLIFGDASLPEFPFALGSFNGLVIDDDVDETREVPGLDLVRRAPASVSLGNNQFQTNDIKLGATQWWYFPKEVLEGVTVNDTSEEQGSDSSKRSPTTLYLSVTICSGPSFDSSNSDEVSDIPQLEVYVSRSPSLQNPGPGQDDSKQYMNPTKEGYMNATESLETDIYIGVAAPDSTKYSGTYSYQIAASTDAFFHSYNDTAKLVEITDTSSTAALLTTNKATDNLTHDQFSLWNKNTPVYTMFAYNLNSTTTKGLQRSYCALKRASQISKGSNLETSMTNRGYKTEEQFYVTGLNHSSTYVGVLAMDGNSTKTGNGIIGGGGKVWKQFTFATKTDENCALLFDMDFCTEIAQAVPARPSMNLSNLRTLYNDRAALLYRNFTYSLQQVQCNTSNESIYSMAVNCGDCDLAYRKWLCAVTIPRCDDFSHNIQGSLIRNADQPFPNGTRITDDRILNVSAQTQSRNEWINTEIQPGPYREILPELSYCHNLTRTCPMSLGFGCPTGKWLQYSYRDTSGAASLLLPPTSIQMLLSALPVIFGFPWLF